MAKILITLAVAMEQVASVVDALAGLGVDDIRIGAQPKADAPAMLRNHDAAVSVAPVARKRADAGKPRGARVVYTLGKRITADRIKSLASLTDTQRTVAMFIARNNGKVGMRDVQKAFDGKINAHTVDGTIFSLRKMDPAIIVSNNVGE